MPAPSPTIRPVVALSGGTGGAKLVDGLSRLLPPDELSVIVNTADDFRHLGLHVSPDVDTVLYTLAGLADTSRGWGVTGDTFRTMAEVEALGGEGWFRLGDRDLATHLARTGWLGEGLALTEATRRLGRALGVRQAVLPMTDSEVRTVVHTADGDRDFQVWFARDGCSPPARSVAYRGAENAQATDDVLHAVSQAGAIVLCPSNPYLSIGPILAVPGMRAALSASRAAIVAVSPIVGGAALKGPAAAMLSEMAGEASCVAVARLYGRLVDGWVIDTIDEGSLGDVERLGCRAVAAPTVMRDKADRSRVASEALSLAAVIAKGKDREAPQ